MRRLLIVLAAVSVLAAGCGGHKASSPPLTKAQYQAELAQIAKHVTSQVGSSTSTVSKFDAKDISGFVAALHAFADKLKAVNPPPEVKDLHAQLIKAMNDVADEFPGIAAKLKATKDPTTALTALFGAKGIQELIKLGNEFKAKGYNLDLNG